MEGSSNGHWLRVILRGFDIGGCVCNTVDFNIPRVVHTGAVIAEPMMNVFRCRSLLKCVIPNKSQLTLSCRDEESFEQGNSEIVLSTSIA